MAQITTFEDFLKRILEIVFWLLIALPMILVPVIFLIVPYIPILLPTGRILTPNEAFVILLDPFMTLAVLTPFFATPWFKAIVFPGFTFAALVATFLGLYERKLLAKIQIRVGPLYAGRAEGILQPFADLFKLLFKEMIVPTKADRSFFVAIPFASAAIASALLAIIPISEFWVVTRSSVGLLIVFAIIGFFPIIVLLAAWASNSKYPFIGGLRALHQMVAYEIPMILATLGIVVMTGSLDLVEIVRAQTGGWFLILLPVGAVVFFITLLAELERIPFDMPEADTEIVAGWLTEYSGMLFGVILGIAVYIKLYAFGALFTVLFLGGWLGPSFLPGEIWFFIKTFFVLTLLIIPRAIFPRYRMDLMLRIGWARLLVLAFINLFIALLLVQFGIMGPGV
uniref:NADH dehydrogenase (Quinone) (NuoH) n=1 Tax=uncultured marine thaumarchaeote KM3_55_F05 TaxID=1456198 RepID=A0A075HES4_9ARCH|nr:NADH dehydrogenase (quinone) (nuoH) [uncultured marine thaumarchaeote KM3_55_F05]